MEALIASDRDGNGWKGGELKSGNCDTLPIILRCRSALILFEAFLSSNRNLGSVDGASGTRLELEAKKSNELTSLRL